MKKYVPYVITLLALGAVTFFFLYRYSPTTLQHEESDFAVRDARKITRIELSNRANEHLVLTQREGKWLVNNVYEPNEEALGLLLEAITKLEPMCPVPNAAQRHVLENMQRQSNLIKIFTEDSTKPEREYVVGGNNATADGTYMILKKNGVLARRPYVTHLPGKQLYLTMRYRPNLEQWRNRWIFRANHENIAYVEVRYFNQPEKSFVIESVGKDSFRLGNGEMVFGEQPKQAYIRQYLNFYEAISMEAYENTNPLRDSVMRTPPYCAFTVRLKNGKVQNATLYYKPIDIKTRQLFDEKGRELKVDAERYFCTINNGQDFVLIQYYVWGKIMRSYAEFFAKPT